ncbi:hypothetical protein EQU24_11670 [Methylotuvimicrobium buryatense]|uniref:Uncharacterized protein n=1 Tax=Methylotuvimicrobium buryatense TaxID=95641 RepID=A0A4P9USV7_METBY|nr:hypothetical protein [Methylotuvimicrobium buryatense]QCW82826.1 hypothetical protein EQU24_11670 [Methylotuvimicrobium buryatense]
MQKLSNENAGSEEGAVARLTGVGGRDSRRRAYKDVFTASCRASNRTLPTRPNFHLLGRWPGLHER